MINKFEKELEKWNGGVLRGAQAKLAKLLRVSTATVALWTTGKRHPSKGYAAQMSQLFGLDIYDVMRLFPPTTTYPDFQPNQPVRSLRDSQGPENTYSADNSETDFSQPLPAHTNSVSLPCLTAFPENYPHYQESDVAEWWTVPLRYAKGAKYLVKDIQASSDELYFIRPEKTLSEGKTMLVKTPQGYTVKKITKQNGKIVLYTAENHFFAEFPEEQITPIGIAVQKLTGIL